MTCPRCQSPLTRFYWQRTEQMIARCSNQSCVSAKIVGRGEWTGEAMQNFMNAVKKGKR